MQRDDLVRRDSTHSSLLSEWISELTTDEGTHCACWQWRSRNTIGPRIPERIDEVVEKLNSLGTTGYLPQPPDDRDKIFCRRPNIIFPPLVDLRDTENVQNEPYNQEWIGSCVANAIASALRFGNSAGAISSIYLPYRPSRMFLYWCGRIACNSAQFPPDQLQLFVDTAINSNGNFDNTDVMRGVNMFGQWVVYRMVDVYMQNINDEGASVRDTIRSLKRVGVCKEGIWLYNLPTLSGTAEQQVMQKLLFYLSNNYSVAPKNALREAARYIDTRFVYRRIHDFGDNPGTDLVGDLEYVLAEGYPIIFAIF